MEAHVYGSSWRELIHVQVFSLNDLIWAPFCTWEFPRKYFESYEEHASQDVYINILFFLYFPIFWRSLFIQS